MPTSPNVLNYSILKGIVKFTPTGGAEQDLGNAPEFELSPEVETIDHVSSRAGVASVDRTMVTQKTLSARIVLDEITPYNLRLALMGGDISTNSDGYSEFGLFENSEITGRITFTGQNDIGNRVNLVLPSVSIQPAGAIPFISDEVAQIELTINVLYVEALGDFGTVEVIDSEDITD